MALSLEDRAAWMKVIDGTAFRGKHPDTPAEVYEYLKRTTVETVELEADGVPFKVYVHTPDNKVDGCTIHINIHGGGFVCPHAENDDIWSALLAVETQGIVVDVDYSLTSEQSAPVMYDQCYAVVPFCQERAESWGADPNRISMGGYSAGGSLTAGVCVMAAQTGDFKLSLAVMGYPVVDMDTLGVDKPDGRKMDARNRARSDAFNELLFDGEWERWSRDPIISPLFADDEILQQFPRSVICSADRCGFRFEDEDFALKLAQLGVEVVLKRYPDSRHGFIPHFCDRWEDAMRLIVREIRNS